MALFKRECLDQALALPIGPLGVLFGKRRPGTREDLHRKLTLLVLVARRMSA